MRLPILRCFCRTSAVPPPGFVTKRSPLYRVIQGILERAPESDDSARLVRAVVLLLIGCCVGLGAAAADIYLHRGIESGDEQPYVVQPTGRELSVNTDLLAFPTDRLELIATVLQSNGFRYIR